MKKYYKDYIDQVEVENENLRNKIKKLQRFQTIFLNITLSLTLTYIVYTYPSLKIYVHCLYLFQKEIRKIFQ